MKAKSESFDERAQRLERSTLELAPTEGFQQRVMVAILQEQTAWWSVVNPLGWRAVPVLVLMALVAAGFVQRAAANADQAMAASYGNSLEIEW